MKEANYIFPLVYLLLLNSVIINGECVLEKQKKRERERDKLNVL